MSGSLPREEAVRTRRAALDPEPRRHDAPSTTTPEAAPKRGQRSDAKAARRPSSTHRTSAKAGRAESLTEPRRHVSRGIRPLAHTFTCRVCGTEFKSPRSDAIYCTNRCRQRRYDREKNDRRGR